MSNRRNIWAYLRPDGFWAVKKEGDLYDLDIFTTQGRAWVYAIAQAKLLQVEAFLKDQFGQIRLRNSYYKDPYPPRG